jgi:hypothetical protein
MRVEGQKKSVPEMIEGKVKNCMRRYTRADERL